MSALPQDERSIGQLFGELAQEQAKDEQVVQFGQRMVQDHGQAVCDDCHDELLASTDS